MRFRVLLGLGCLLGSLVSCATGGNFVGTGGSSTGDGGDGAGGGSGGATTTTGTGSTTGSGTTTTVEMCAEAPCKLAAPQCGCADGAMCAINGMGERECHEPAGDKLVEQECAGLYSCAPGLICTQVSSATSLCNTYCEGDAQCGGGQCIIELNDPTNPGTPLPGIKLCSNDCDPMTSAGCPAGLGLSCQLGQTDEGAPVFSNCYGAGAGTQGASCVDNEDCAPGSACFNTGTLQCLQWCKPPSGACPGAATCLSFETPLFYKGVEYGVCL